MTQDHMFFGPRTEGHVWEVEKKDAEIVAESIESTPPLPRVSISMCQVPLQEGPNSLGGQQLRLGISHQKGGQQKKQVGGYFQEAGGREANSWGKGEQHEESNKIYMLVTKRTLLVLHSNPPPPGEPAEATLIWLCTCKLVWFEGWLRLWGQLRRIPPRRLLFTPFILYSIDCLTYGSSIKPKTQKTSKGWHDKKRNRVGDKNGGNMV